MKFRGELRIEEVPSRPDRWVLTAPLSWGPYTVPRQFETDFASVPKLLWNFFPPYGEHTKAAVLHDYLYRRHPGKTTRRSADRIFLTAMLQSRTPRLRAYIMWSMVRLFGARAWRTSSP